MNQEVPLKVMKKIYNKTKIKFIKISVITVKMATKVPNINLNQIQLLINTILYNQFSFVNYIKLINLK